MSEYRREARRLEREVAEKREWIDKVLRLEPEKQNALYQWLDAEVRSAPAMTEASQMSMLPVEGAEIRLLHSRPRRAPEGGAPPARPILFVPGWGAVPG